jgi:hypothetical protein
VWREGGRRGAQIVEKILLRTLSASGRRGNPANRAHRMNLTHSMRVGLSRGCGHNAVIRVYDEAGNVIQIDEQAVVSSGDFWFHR